MHNDAKEEEDIPNVEALKMNLKDEGGKRKGKG